MFGLGGINLSGIFKKDTGTAVAGPSVMDSTRSNVAVLDSVDIGSGAVGITDVHLRNLLIRALDTDLENSVFTPQACQIFKDFLINGSSKSSVSDLAQIHEMMMFFQRPEAAELFGLSFDQMQTLYDACHGIKGNKNVQEVSEAKLKRDTMIEAMGMGRTELDFRRLQYLINPDSKAVTDMTKSLFDSGVIRKGMDAESVAAAVLDYIQSHFEYMTDQMGDRWQTASQTLDRKGGDCEDLTVLTASVLMGALERTGFSAEQTRDMVTLSAGFVRGEGGSGEIGHTIVTLKTSGKTIGLDATGTGGFTDLDAIRFDRLFEMNDQVFISYKDIPTHFETALRFRTSVINQPPGEAFVEYNRNIDPKTVQFSSLLDAINYRTEQLTELLSKPLDIPRVRFGNIYRMLVNQDLSPGSPVRDLQTKFDALVAHARATGRAEFSYSSGSNFETFTIDGNNVGRLEALKGESVVAYSGTKAALTNAYGNSSSQYRVAKLVPGTDTPMRYPNGDPVLVSISRSEFDLLSDNATIYKIFNLYETVDIGKISVNTFYNSFDKTPDELTASGFTSYENFEFFTLKRVDIPFNSPSTSAITDFSMVSVEINDRAFYSYITNVLDQVNQITTLFRAGLGILELIYMESEEMSSDHLDEQTRQDLKDSSSKNNLQKFSESVDKWQSKISSGIRDISNELFNFISSTNDAESKRVNMLIDIWPRTAGDSSKMDPGVLIGNILLGITGTLADEWTGALTYERSVTKVALNQTASMIVARNAAARARLAYTLTTRIEMWDDPEHPDTPDYELPIRTESAWPQGWSESVWRAQDTSIEGTAQQLAYGGVSKGDILSFLAGLGGTKIVAGAASAGIYANSEIGQMISILNSSDFDATNPAVNMGFLYWIQGELSDNPLSGRDRIETVQNANDDSRQFKARLFNMASDSTTQTTAAMDFTATTPAAGSGAQQLQEMRDTERRKNDLKDERVRLRALVASNTTAGRDSTVELARLDAINVLLESLQGIPNLLKQQAADRARLAELVANPTLEVVVGETQAVTGRLVTTATKITEARQAVLDPPNRALETNTAAGDGLAQLDSQLPASGKPELPADPPDTSSGKRAYLDFNAPRTLEVKMKMVAYQNFLRVSLLVKQLLLENMRQAAEALSGKQSSVVLGGGSRVASQALEAELNVQFSHFDATLQESLRLNDSVNELVSARFEYYKAAQRVIMSTIRTTAQAAIEVTSIIIGTIMDPIGKIVGYDKPYFAYMLNTIGGAVIESVFNLWDLGIEYRTHEFYKPSVIQTYDNPYNAQYGRYLQNQSLAYQNSTGTIVKDGDPSTIKGIFKTGSVEQRDYFENRFNQLRLSGQINFGGGGEKTFHNVNTSFTDVVPDFVASRGDGFYSKDSYGMFFKEGPGGYDPTVSGNHGITFSAHEGTDWSEFNKIKMISYLFYAFLSHLQQAAKDMSGVAPKSNFAQFETQMDAYLTYEKSVIASLKAEVDAVIKAATVNANKDKKRVYLKDDAALGALKIPASLLSLLKEPANRFAYSAATIPIEQADLLRKKAGAQYSGLNANYRNPDNQTLAAGIAGMPSVDRSAPGSPYRMIGGVDPTAALFNLESLEDSTGSLGVLDPTVVADLTTTVNDYYRHKQETLWQGGSGIDAVAVAGRSIGDIEHDAATLARWVNWENEEKKLMNDVYLANQDNPYKPTALPMTSPDFHKAIEATQKLAKIGALRVILLMALQMLYKQKQNVLKEMCGYASQANLFQRSMNIVDRYNSFQADAMEGIVQEFAARSEANNVFQSELISLSIESPTVALIGVYFIQYPKKAPADPAEGGGDKFVNIYKKIVAGQIAKMIAQALGNVAVSMAGLMSEKQTPKMDSEFLTYQHADPVDKTELKNAKDRKTELEGKKKNGTASDADLKELGQSNTRIAKAQSKIVSGNQNAGGRRSNNEKTDMGINSGQIKFTGGGTVFNTAIQQQAKAKIERAARRVELINTIVISGLSAKSDVAADMSGVDSAKMGSTFSSVLGRLKQGQLAAVGMIFQAVQALADQRNQNMERLVKAITDGVMQGIKAGMMKAVTTAKKKKENKQRATKKGLAQHNADAKANHDKLKALKTDQKSLQDKVDSKKKNMTGAEKKQYAKDKKDLKATKKEIGQREVLKDDLKEKGKVAKQTLKENRAKLVTAQTTVDNLKTKSTVGMTQKQLKDHQQKIKSAEAKLDQTTNLIKHGSKRDPGPTRSADKMNEASRNLFQLEQAFKVMEKINGLFSHMLADMLVSTAAPSMVAPGDSGDQGAANSMSVAAQANDDQMRMGLTEGNDVMHDVATTLGAFPMIPTAELENAVLSARYDAGTYAALAKNAKAQERFFKVMAALLKQAVVYTGKSGFGINEDQMLEVKRKLEQSVLKAVLKAQDEATIKGRDVTPDDVMRHVMVPEFKLLGISLNLKAIAQTEAKNHERMLYAATGVKNFVFGNGKNVSDVGRDATIKNNEKQLKDLTDTLASLRQQPMTSENKDKIEKLQIEHQARQEISDSNKNVKTKNERLQLAKDTGASPQEIRRLDLELKGLEKVREEVLSKHDQFSAKNSVLNSVGEFFKRRGLMGILPGFNVLRPTEPMPGYRELKERQQGKEYLDRIMFSIVLQTNGAILNNEKDTFNAFATTDPRFKDLVVTDQRADLKLLMTGTGGSGGATKLMKEKLTKALENMVETMSGSQLSGMDLTDSDIKLLVDSGVLKAISKKVSDDGTSTPHDKLYKVMVKDPSQIAALKGELVGPDIDGEKNPMKEFFAYYTGASVDAASKLKASAKIDEFLGSLDMLQELGVFTQGALANALARRGIPSDEANKVAGNVLAGLKKEKFVSGGGSDGLYTFTDRFYDRRFRSKDAMAYVNGQDDPIDKILKEAITGLPNFQLDILKSTVHQASASQGAVFGLVNDISNFFKTIDPLAAKQGNLLSSITSMASELKTLDAAMKSNADKVYADMLVARLELLEAPVFKLSLSDGRVAIAEPLAAPGRTGVIPILFKAGNESIIVEIEPGSGISTSQALEALQKQRPTVTVVQESLSSINASDNSFKQHDAAVINRDKLVKALASLEQESRQTTQDLKQIALVVDALNSVRNEVAIIESLKKAELFMMSNLKSGDAEADILKTLSDNQVGTADAKGIISALMDAGFLSEAGRLTQSGMTMSEDDIKALPALGLIPVSLNPGINAMAAVVATIKEQQTKETLLDDMRTRGGQDLGSQEALRTSHSILKTMSDNLSQAAVMPGSDDDTKELAATLDSLKNGLKTYADGGKAGGQDSIARVLLVAAGLPGVTRDEALDKVLGLSSPGALAVAILTAIPVVGQLDWAGLRDWGLKKWRKATNTEDVDNVTGNVMNRAVGAMVSTSLMNPDNRRLVENATRMEQAGINPNDLMKNMRTFLGDDDVNAMVSLLTMSLKDIFDFDGRDSTSKLDLERTIFDSAQNAVDTINKLMIDSAPPEGGDGPSRSEQTKDRANVRKAAMVVLKLGEELLKYSGSTPEMSQRYLGLIMQELERQHSDKFDLIMNDLIELSESSGAQKTMNQLLGVMTSDETRFYKDITNRSVLTHIPIIGERFLAVDGLDRADEAELALSAVGLQFKQTRGKESIQALIGLDNIGLLISRLTDEDLAGDSGFSILQTNESVLRQLVNRLMEQADPNLAQPDEFRPNKATPVQSENAKKALANLSSLIGVEALTNAIDPADVGNLMTIIDRGRATQSFFNAQLAKQQFSPTMSKAGQGTHSGLNQKAMAERLTYNRDTHENTASDAGTLLKELTEQLKSDAPGTLSLFEQEDNLVNLSILLQNAMRGGATEEARDFTTQLMRQGSEANKVKNALKDTLLNINQNLSNPEVQSYLQRVEDGDNGRRGGIVLDSDTKALSKRVAEVGADVVKSKSETINTLNQLQSAPGSELLRDGLRAESTQDKLLDDLAKSVAAALANRAQTLPSGAPSGSVESVDAGNLIFDATIKAIEAVTVTEGSDGAKRQSLIDRFTSAVSHETDVLNAQLAEPLQINLAQLSKHVAESRDYVGGPVKDSLARNIGTRGVAAAVARELRQANRGDSAVARSTFNKLLSQSPAELKEVYRRMVVDSGDRRTGIALIRSRIVNAPLGNDHQAPQLAALISSVSTAITPKSSPADRQAVELFHSDLIMELKGSLATATDQGVKDSLKSLIATAEKEYKIVREMNGKTRFSEADGSGSRSGLVRDGMARAMYADDAMKTFSGLLKDQAEILREMAPATPAGEPDHPLKAFSDQLTLLSAIDPTIKPVEFSVQFGKVADALNALSGTNIVVSQDQLATAQSLSELSGLMAMHTSAPLPDSGLNVASDAFSRVVSSASAPEFSQLLTGPNKNNFSEALTHYLKEAPLDADMMGVFGKISQHSNVDDTQKFIPLMFARLNTQVSPEILADPVIMSALESGQDDHRLASVQTDSTGSTSASYRVPSDVNTFNQLLNSPALADIDPAKKAVVLAGLKDAFYLSSGDGLADRATALTSLNELQSKRVGATATDQLAPALLSVLSTSVEIGRTGETPKVSRDVVAGLARYMESQSTSVPDASPHKPQATQAIKDMKDATTTVEVDKAFSTWMTAMSSSGMSTEASKEPKQMQKLIQDSMSLTKSRKDLFSFTKGLANDGPRLNTLAANFNNSPQDADVKKLTQVLSDPTMVAQLKKEDPAAYLGIIQAFAVVPQFPTTAHQSVIKDIELARNPVFQSFLTADPDQRGAVLHDFSALSTPQDRIAMMNLMRLSPKEFNGLFSEFDSRVAPTDLAAAQVVVSTSPGTAGAPSRALSTTELMEFLYAPTKGTMVDHPTQAGARELSLVSTEPTSLPGVLLSSGSLSPQFLDGQGKVRDTDIMNSAGNIVQRSLKTHVGTLLQEAFNINPATAPGDAQVQAIVDGIKAAALRPAQAQGDIDQLRFDISTSAAISSPDKGSLLHTLNQSKRQMDDRTHTLLSRVLQYSKQAQAQFDIGNVSQSNSAIKNAALTLDSMIPTLMDSGMNEQEIRTLLDPAQSPGDRAFNLVAAFQKIETHAKTNPSLKLSPVEKKSLEQSRNAVSTLLLNRLTRDPEFKQANQARIGDFLKGLADLGETVDRGLKGLGNPVHALMRSKDQSPMLMHQFMALFEGNPDPKLMETLLERSGIFNPTDAVQMSRLVDFMSVHPAGAAGVVNYIGDPVKKAEALNQLMAPDGVINWGDPVSIRKHSLAIDTFVEVLRVSEKPQDFLPHLDLMKPITPADSQEKLWAHIYQRLSFSPVQQKAFLDALPSTVGTTVSATPAAVASITTHNMNLPMSDPNSLAALLALKSSAYNEMKPGGNLAAFEAEFATLLQNTPPGSGADTAGFTLLRDLMVNPLYRSQLVGMMTHPMPAPSTKTIGECLGALIRSDLTGAIFNDRTTTMLLNHGPVALKQSALSKGDPAVSILDYRPSRDDVVAARTAAATAAEVTANPASTPADIAAANAAAQTAHALPARPVLVYAALLDDSRINHTARLPFNMSNDDVASLMKMASDDGQLQVVSSLLRSSKYQLQSENALTNLMKAPATRQQALNVVAQLNDGRIASQVVLDAFKALLPTATQEDYREFLNSTVLSPQFMSGLSEGARASLTQRVLNSCVTEIGSMPQRQVMVDALASLLGPQAPSAASALTAAKFASPEHGIIPATAGKTPDDVILALQRRNILDANGQLTSQYDPTRSVIGLLVDITSGQSTHINQVLQAHYHAQSHGISDSVKDAVAQVVMASGMDLNGLPKGKAAFDFLAGLSTTDLSTINDARLNSILEAVFPPVQLPVVAANIALAPPLIPQEYVVAFVANPANQALVDRISGFARSHPDVPAPVKAVIARQSILPAGAADALEALATTAAPPTFSPLLKEIVISKTQIPQGKFSDMAPADQAQLIRLYDLLSERPQGPAVAGGPGLAGTTLTLDEIQDVLDQLPKNANPLMLRLLATFEGRDAAPAVTGVSPLVSNLMDKIAPLDPNLSPVINLISADRADLAKIAKDPILLHQFLDQLSQRDLSSGSSVMTVLGKDQLALLFDSVTTIQGRQLQQQVVDKMTRDFLTKPVNSVTTGFEDMHWLQQYNSRYLISTDSFVDESPKGAKISLTQSQNLFSVLSGSTAIVGDSFVDIASNISPTKSQEAFALLRGLGVLSNTGEVTASISPAKELEIANELSKIGFSQEGIHKVVNTLTDAHGLGVLSKSGAIKTVISPEKELEIKNKLVEMGYSKEAIDKVIDGLKTASQPDMLTKRMVEKMIASSVGNEAEFKAFTRKVLTHPDWNSYQKMMILMPVVAQLKTSTTAGGDHVMPEEFRGGFWSSMGKTALNIFNIHPAKAKTKRPGLDLLKDIHSQLKPGNTEHAEIFAQVLATSIRTRGRDYLLRFGDVKTNEARFLRKVLKDDFLKTGGVIYNSLATILARGKDVPSGPDKQLLDIVQRHVDHMVIFDKVRTGDETNLTIKGKPYMSTKRFDKAVAGSFGKSLQEDVHNALEKQVRQAMVDENQSVIESVCRSLSLMGLQHQDTSWINALVLEKSTFNQSKFTDILPASLDAPGSAVIRNAISDKLLVALSSPENGYLQKDPASGNYYRTGKELTSEAGLNLDSILSGIPSGVERMKAMRAITHELRAPHILVAPMIRLSRDEFSAGQARSRRSHLLYNRQAFRYDQIMQKPGSKTTAAARTKAEFKGGPTKPQNYLAEYLHYHGNGGQIVRTMVDDMYQRTNYTDGQGSAQRRGDYYARQLMNTDANELAGTLASAPRGLVPDHLDSLATPQLTRYDIWQGLLSAGYVKENGDITDKFDPEGSGRLDKLPPQFDGLHYELRQVLKGALFAASRGLVSDSLANLASQVNQANPTKPQINQGYIWSELISAGYIKADGKVTDKFDPKEVGALKGLKSELDKIHNELRQVLREASESRANFAMKSLVDPDIEMNYTAQKRGFMSTVEANDKMKKIVKLQALTAEMINALGTVTSKIASGRPYAEMVALRQQQANLKEQLLYVHANAATLFDDVMRDGIPSLKGKVSAAAKSTVSTLLFGVNADDYHSLSQVKTKVQSLANIYLESSKKKADSIKLADSMMTYIKGAADPALAFQQVSTTINDLAKQPRFKTLASTLGTALDTYAKENGMANRSEVVLKAVKGSITAQSTDKAMERVASGLDVLGWSSDKGADLVTQYSSNKQLLTSTLAFDTTVIETSLKRSLALDALSTLPDLSTKTMDALQAHGILELHASGKYTLQPAQLHQWEDAQKTLTGDPATGAVGPLDKDQFDAIRSIVDSSMPQGSDQLPSLLVSIAGDRIFKADGSVNTQAVKKELQELGASGPVADDLSVALTTPLLLKRVTQGTVKEFQSSVQHLALSTLTQAEIKEVEARLKSHGLSGATHKKITDELTRLSTPAPTTPNSFRDQIYREGFKRALGQAFGQGDFQSMVDFIDNAATV